MLSLLRGHSVLKLWTSVPAPFRCGNAHSFFPLNSVPQTWSLGSGTPFQRCVSQQCVPTSLSGSPFLYHSLFNLSRRWCHLPVSILLLETEQLFLFYPWTLFPSLAPVSQSLSGTYLPKEEELAQEVEVLCMFLDKLLFEDS